MVPERSSEIQEAVVSKETGKHLSKSKQVLLYKVMMLLTMSNL